MADVLAKNPLQLTFTQWDQEVQAFSPNRADQPFAEGVRLGRSNRRFQNTDAEALRSRIQARGEDSIAVVDDVTVRMVKRQEPTELLNGPLSGRVLSDLAV